MRIRAYVLGAALAVPMTLAGQTTNYNINNKASNNTSQLSNQDKLFLHTIASEDSSEIDLAKLALQKSQNAQIQEYAKTKILAADPGMKEKAKELAEQNHTSISSTPNPTAKLTYKQLSNFSGKKFDRSYAKYEGWKQAADLKAVQNEANSATDPRVRAYAQQEIGPVQEAAQSARQLADSMHVTTQE